MAAPENAKPAGRYATLSGALDAFLKSRAATIRFVEECEEDLRLKVTAHPILGPANCDEMLLMIAIHPQRHAKQIEEIRSQNAQRAAAG